MKLLAAASQQEGFTDVEARLGAGSDEASGLVDESVTLAQAAVGLDLDVYYRMVKDVEVPSSIVDKIERQLVVREVGCTAQQMYERCGQVPTDCQLWRAQAF